ncbi:MAG: hypothetical protein CM1200mP2_42590 [Planctomycetaceae bacterium]|nr:MAG: hypothetical protein CM1200mP2_42590 [Planctomycetaceae bacterium]
MARRRSSTRSSFGVMWLGLLSLVVVGWMGWRSGWWPVDVAPAETTTAVENSSLEQARRAATLENRVTLPEQFEPRSSPASNSHRSSPFRILVSGGVGKRRLASDRRFTGRGGPRGTNDPAGSPQIRRLPANSRFPPA